MWKKITKAMPYVLLFASFAVLLVLNLFYQTNWLDSDMAAEMRFAKLLAEEGHLIATPDWYYSTEFRVLYTQLVMTPLFHVLTSWHAIRTITNMVFYALLAGSFYYCVRPLQVKRATAVLTSVILLLPFSETVITHVQIGNTYISHIILIFFFLGLFLRLVKEEEPNQKKGRRILLLGAYLLLAVICGMSGVRYLMVLQCPLFLAVLWYFLSSKAFLAYRREPSATKWKGLKEAPEWNYFKYGIIGLIASLAGYGINALWLTKIYTFQTYGFMNFITIEDGLFNRIQNALGCLFLMLGYIPERSVLSLRGVITLSVFLMLAIFIFCTVRVVKRTEGGRKFTALFTIASVFLNLFVFVFTSSTMVPRYFLPVFALVPLVLCVYGEMQEYPFDKAAVCVLLSACLLLGTAKTIYSYTDSDRNASKRNVAEFLKNSEYHFGFATYSNATIVTEITDGVVEVGIIDNPDTLNYFTWSSPKKYYEEDYCSGKVFLLLPWEERLNWADAKALEIGEKVFDDGVYSVYVFDSVAALKACAAVE